jgi:Domain of unknown function DUF11/WD40-like Beta Propeller Repeat
MNFIIGESHDNYTFTNKQTNKQTNNKLRPLVIALQAALATGVALPAAPIWGAETTRVSVDSAGVQSNGHAFSASISADGRFVAFNSNSSNLVAGDTNGVYDVFVRDRLTNQTTRISVNSAGVQGDNTSQAIPSISADGRFVAFDSKAFNLVVGDNNGTPDVFVRDRATNQTTCVSVDNAGTQGIGGYFGSRFPSISADGRFVAFYSDAPNLVVGDNNVVGDIFVRDRATNQTTRVSVDSAGTQSNGGSLFPTISANGRFVAFASEARNLVTGDTNAGTDIFVRDRATNQTTRVSVDSAGMQGNGGYFNGRLPSISADGRFVAFESLANNLVAGDTNGTWDIFIRDRATNQTTRVSLDSAGAQSNNDSFKPSISADGRFVSFGSDASNLVPGDTNNARDTFVRDRATNQTTRVSVDSAGIQGNNLTGSRTAISADGSFVAFESLASNLVAGDTNGFYDTFVRDRLLNPALTANLVLTQTVAPNPVTVGANLGFTATVLNQGPHNAGFVTLTGIPSLGGRLGLPPTLTPSQGTCYRGIVSVCRLGTLNAGQQATVTMTFPAKFSGTVFNRVTASAGPKDPSPFNTATTNATINP